MASSSFARFFLLRARRIGGTRSSVASSSSVGPSAFPRSVAVSFFLLYIFAGRCFFSLPARVRGRVSPCNASSTTRRLSAIGSRGV